MALIFVLEDDRNIRELVLYTLGSSGFTSEGFSKPSEFFGSLEKTLPTLIILDIMLPEQDGLSVLKKLKRDRNFRNIPVIILTAKDSEFDRIIGLDIGADDYLTKPFAIMELMARVRAVLRRVPAGNEAQNDEKIVYKELEMFPAKHKVKLRGDVISLTQKEYLLLITLMQSPEIVFTRDVLLDSVWGYDFDGENRTVDVHVRTLRQKLSDYGRFIETVRGAGYRFNGEQND
ncbi:MAG: response regulator transcription factor [Eubacterium sp.]|jgi:two-component system alkaline phosphatase synthesis response regulator PhoP|nr:response regulator transcription factor [Eubacterium sp.]